MQLHGTSDPGGDTERSRRGVDHARFHRGTADGGGETVEGGAPGDEQPVGVRRCEITSHGGRGGPAGESLLGEQHPFLSGAKMVVTGGELYRSARHKPVIDPRTAFPRLIGERDPVVGILVDRARVPAVGGVEPHGHVPGHGERAIEDILAGGDPLKEELPHAR